MTVEAALADSNLFLPWTDRPGPQAGAPRSDRDVTILRGLARRIPANDAGAHNNLGVVFFQKGMHADAAEQFERALELDPRMQVAERNLQIVYFGTDYYDRTLEQLNQRLAANADDAAARSQLARTYLFGGDARAALREWQRLVTERPGDPEAEAWIARAEVRRGDLDGAVQVLARAAEKHPDNARLALQMGEILYLRGMAAEASRWLERCLALDENHAEAHHLIAFVYGELGHAARAQEHAARAAALNPSFAKADRSLSLDRYNEARYSELTGDRGKPVVTEGGGLVHYNMGLALRQKALYEEALKEFKLADERGEDRYLVMQAQAEMMLLLGNGGQAASLYTELIEEEPASPKLWNELGVAQHQLGRLADAEASYARAIGLDPKYTLAWNNLGVVRHHRTQEGSEEALESALAAGRSLAEIWRNLGWLHHLRKDWVGAEHAYRQALDVDTRLATAWTGLGMLFLERGRAEPASTALARAVECDPNLPEAHYHYAFALSASGDYPAALRETSRALELNPYITLPRFRLLIDLQFEDAAVTAPELDAPERLMAGATVEHFDFEAEDISLALEAVEPRVPEASKAEPELSLPSKPASIEWLAAARASLHSGHYAEAMADVQRAVALGANRIEAQLLQGEIHLLSGAAGEAVDRFDEVLHELQWSVPQAWLDEKDIRVRALAGMARSLLDLERAPEAVDFARKARELAPSAETASLEADALLSVGVPLEAAGVLERALAENPENVELRTRLGAAWLQAGDVARAEPMLRGALERESELPAARATLGRLLAIEGRSTDAEQEYRAALHVIPSFTDAAIGLADLLAEQGRLDEAINVLATFLEADPYSFFGLVRLGDVLWRAGREIEAGFAYRRILHFDPGHEEAREGLERLEPHEEDVDASWTVVLAE